MDIKMSINIKDINSSDFKNEVLESEVPVLVDFWAPWCGPCVAMAPGLERAADEFMGKVKVIKVNIDKNQDIARKYSIRGIPTLMMFKNGDVNDTKVGMISAVQISEFVNKNLV